MATVREVITDALASLGQISAVDTPSAADADLCLRALNRRIDAWAAERLSMFTVTRSPWTITANQAAYTLGPGGDIDVPWPYYVQHVHFQDASLPQPVEMPLSYLDDDAYSRWPIKSLTNSYPTCWYSDGAFPLANLTLLPTPTSATLTGYLYAATQVSEFSDLSDTVALPPGYRRLLVLAIACEVAPSFVVPEGRLSLLLAQLDEATRVVKTANAKAPVSALDLGALPRGNAGRYTYNIFAGP